MRLPLVPPRSALQKDLRTLAVFIETYSRGKHPGADREPLPLKTHDVKEIVGHEVSVCRDCSRLLTHAFVKRMTCRMDPKPWCKHCPKHCYDPRYRAQIRQVMKYAGMRLVLTGRLDYLAHFLF
jgi:hypothetical protein